MICLYPADVLARDEKIDRLEQMALAAISFDVSFNATAAPNALAPRESDMDFRVSFVATDLPLNSASFILPAVSNGHLIWTKWTSLLS